MCAVSIAVAILFLSLSSAQSTAGIPECASDCVAAGFGDCGGFDAQCICTNTQLIANLSCCVSQSCDQAGQEATLTFAQGICDAYDANLPTAASCAASASSAGSSTSSAAATGSSSTMTSGSTTTTAMSGSDSQSASAGASEASASASQAADNAGVRNDRIESGLCLGLAVAGAGLLAAI